MTKNKRISFCKDSEWKINFETNKRKIKILIIYDLLFSYCFDLVFGYIQIKYSFSSIDFYLFSFRNSC